MCALFVADGHPAQLLINSAFSQVAGIVTILQLLIEYLNFLLGQVTAQRYYPAAVAGLGFGFSLGKRSVTTSYEICIHGRYY